MTKIPPVVLMRVRLKITKKSSGTYAVESLSIKQIREISKLKDRRRWDISRDGLNIYLEAEESKSFKKKNKLFKEKKKTR